MGMLAESKRQRAHTAEVACGQLQQLQNEKAMAMEQAFLSEKARADAAERHAAEMRRVVHVLKDHVLKEQARSSTRPVFSTDLKEHRAARDQAAPAAGRKKQQQHQTGAASRKALSYLGRSDSRARYTTSQVCLPVCILAALEGEKLVTFSWFSRQEHSSPVEFLPRGSKDGCNDPELMECRMLCGIIFWRENASEEPPAPTS